MTISTQDYADLSGQSYKAPIWIKSRHQYKTEIINGIKYSPLEYMNDPATGYQWTIYQREDTGEIVVAHRGTEPPSTDSKDAGADATMVFQRVNPQVKDAEALTQNALKYAEEYAEKHPESKIALQDWVSTIKKSDWECFADIKKTYNSVDNVGNQRYVFNIKGNNYRLVVVIKFTIKFVYIRFIGTHKEYDKIDCSTI